MSIQFKKKMKDDFITALNTIIRYNSYDINEYTMQSQTIIINCFKFNPDIDYELKDVIVGKMINEYRNYVNLMDLLNNKEYDEIIYKFEEIARRIFKEFTGKQEDYKIIFFTNIDYGLFESRNEFNVLDTKIHILKWDDIDGMNLNDGLQKIRMRNRYKDLNPLFFTKLINGYEQYRVNKKFTPVMISIKSFHPYQAFRDADYIFLLWRVSINLQHSLSLFSRMDTGGRPALPLSKCMLSPAVFLFNQEGTFEGVATNDIFINYQFMNKKSIDFDSFDYTLSMINDKNKKINELIREILSLYQEALDELTPSGIFMRFWHTLERICIDEPSGKNTLPRLFTLVSASPNGIWQRFKQWRAIEHNVK